MLCGQDSFASEKVFEYFQDRNDSRLTHFSGGKKVLKNFQDNDDLRLRQFCRRKSL